MVITVAVAPLEALFAEYTKVPLYPPTLGNVTVPPAADIATLADCGGGVEGSGDDEAPHPESAAISTTINTQLAMPQS